MKLSDKGRDLLERLEAKRLKAYKCSAGVWTIGIGHTGEDVYEGLEITDEEVTRLFKEGFSKIRESCKQRVP